MKIVKTFEEFVNEKKFFKKNTCVKCKKSKRQEDDGDGYYGGYDNVDEDEKKNETAE